MAVVSKISFSLMMILCSSPSKRRHDDDHADDGGISPRDDPDVGEGEFRGRPRRRLFDGTASMSSGFSSATSLSNETDDLRSESVGPMVVSDSQTATNDALADDYLDAVVAQVQPKHDGGENRAHRQDAWRET